MDPLSFIDKIPIYWVAELLENLTCALCFFLLFPPMQLTCCGKRVCAGCGSTKLKQYSQCPFCSAPGIPEAKPDKGYERELKKLEVCCPRCNEKCPTYFPDLHKHLENHRDLQCSNCEERFIFPKELENHQRETCKNRVVACPLNFIGCSKSVSFAQLGKHTLSNEHQLSIFAFVKAITLQSSEQQDIITFTKPLENSYQHLLLPYQVKIDALNEETDRITENCDQLESERKIKETSINEVRAQFANINKSSESNIQLIADIHGILMGMSKILDDIKSKSLTGPKLLSWDGLFIWNIKFSEFKNNRQSIQSEPFHSSQSGYKLALRCEIYEDKLEKTSYISISFVILLGEYDAILTWPFEYPITLSIVDLSIHKKDISYEITNESRALPFSRPINNINSPYRVEKFCPLNKLSKSNSNYLQNDTMFVRAYIDFSKPTTNSVSSKEQVKVTTSNPIHHDIVSNTLVN
ncbi:hypothetical protein I4U23_003455 [Adineta vaga]|nr:hypothetical protein I4U23_003455 [Adineta vaga]